MCVLYCRVVATGQYSLFCQHHACRRRPIGVCFGKSRAGWLPWGSRLVRADRPRLAAECGSGPLGSRFKAPLGSVLDSRLGVDHSQRCWPLSRSRAPLTIAIITKLLGRTAQLLSPSTLHSPPLSPPPSTHPSPILSSVCISNFHSAHSHSHSTLVIFQSCCSTLLLQLLHSRSSPVALVHPSSWIDTDISQSPICFPLYLEQYI